MCAYSKKNEDYSKHDFWSMVPREQTLERKFKCVFQHLDQNEIGSEEEDDNSDEMIREARKAEGEMIEELEKARTKLLVRESNFLASLFVFTF